MDTRVYSVRAYAAVSAWIEETQLRWADGRRSHHGVPIHSYPCCSALVKLTMKGMSLMIARCSLCMTTSIA